ncbi:hypothetical protein HDU67_004484 [Dinochytrium kinnereticum]|nr:hypothetical protein HDU67_004484 [Dinochytrium kinnereticum]
MGGRPSPQPGPTPLHVTSLPNPLTSWEPITARSIKSFAVYLGDLAVLMKRVTGFHRVDLLVVSAEEVASLGVAGKVAGSGGGAGGPLSAALGNGSSAGLAVHPVYDDYDPQLSGGQKSPKAMSRVGSSSSLSTIMLRSSKPWTSNPFTRQSSPQPPSSPHGTSNDATFTPDETDLHLQKLHHHFKHLIVSVNVFDVYTAYDASARKLGSSFSKHFVGWVLERVVGVARFPVSGVLLMGLKETAGVHPAGDGFVMKLVAALKGEREFWGGVVGRSRAIYLDEHGVAVWDKIRDDVNGIFFTNNMITKKGTFRPRFGGDRVEFDEITNRLKIEITLRDDFMVFGIEPVQGGPDRLDAAVTRHAISWYRGLGFLFWFCHHDGDDLSPWDGFGRNVEDVRPPKLTQLSDDSIFEMAVHPAVKSLKGVVERRYVEVLRGGGGGGLGPVVWSNLLDRPMPDPAARFFAGVRRLLNYVTEQHFDDVMYERVDAVHPGRCGEVVVEREMSPSSESAYVTESSEMLKDLPVNLVRNLSRVFDVDRTSRIQDGDDDQVESANTIAFPKHHTGNLKRASFFSTPSSTVAEHGRIDGGNGGYSHASTITCLIVGIASQSSEARRDRLSVLLRRNLTDLGSKKLLASLKKNVDVESSSPSPKFTQCLETLTSFITHPSRAARWLCDTVGPSMGVKGYTEMRAIAADLVEGLNDGTVNVWLASKAAFLSGDDGDEVVWAFAEVRNEVVNVYVADHAVGVGELVLNAFGRLVMRWGGGRGLVLEAVVVAQSQKDDDDTFPVPSRIAVEVESQSHSGRLRLIRNAPLVLSNLQSSATLTGGEIAYLSHLTDHVSRLSEQILIDRQAYEDLKLSWARDAYAPRNDLEVTLCGLVGKCTFDGAGSKRFVSVMETMKEWLGTFSGVNAETHATCLLFMSIQKAIRRCAYMELQVSLLNKNALFLPDADQVAVGLEMTTTQENIRCVFELTSLQLSTPMHTALREMGFRELREPSKPEKKVDAVPVLKRGEGEVGEGHAAGHKKRKDEGHVMEKKITNAYLFIYPILIDLVLVRLVGSGIFYSDRMSLAAQYSVTLIFLIMYPIIGGVMNSIGRTVTYYFYQKSIPLMIAAFLRRLAAGIIVAVCGSAVVAGIDYFLNRNYITVILTFLYSVGFCLYMVFLCGLVSFKDPDDFFFQSAGPRVVFLTIPMLSVSAFVSRFGFKEGGSNSTIVWGIYTFVILFTVSFMAWSYRRIAITYINWPDSIDVTTRASIIELYVKEASAKPVQGDGEDLEAFERRKRRWERSAIEWWMGRVEKAMSSKKVTSSSEPAIVKKRVAQRRWEDMLMKWYFERSGSTAPKRYSNEWDIALKQALGELRKKYNVEKLNRGDILFDFESPAIVFGFLYFIIIFVDKWCLLIVTGQAALFLPTSAISRSYVAGVLYGTIFLLIASGILELTLGFMYEKQKGIIQQSLSHAKSMEKMVEDHWTSIRKIYRGELNRFLGFTLLIFVIITIPVVAFNRDSTTLIVYAATSFGYFGLLVGLFHKLFITSDERFLNRWMFIGLVLSVGTICVLLKVTKNMLWASGTITLNGWLFGLACLATYSRESLGTVHYRITISPTLTSSGQRMIGHVHGEANQERLNDLGKRLLDNQGRFTVLLPTSELGRRIAKRIQTSLYRVTMLPHDHLLNIAFPTARALADSIVARFYDRHLVIHLVPARIEISGVQYHAISITEGDYLHIFFDGPDTDVGWSDDDLINLCECIVHESAEDLGMSHSDACAFEALVSLQEEMSLDVNVLAQWVPNRVQKYLAGVGTASHRRFVNATEGVVGEKACLNVEVDRFWGCEGGVSHQDRCALVALTKDWFYLFGDASQNALLPEHIDYAACDSVINVREGSDRITMRMALARSLISAIMAENIKSACQNTRMVGVGNRFQTSRRTTRKRNRISQFIGTISRSAAKENTEVYVEDLISGSLGRRRQMKMDQNLSNHKVQAGFFTRVTGIFIDAIVAFFLSLTADVRFGRELAVTPWLVRGPLALLYYISRKLVGWLTQTFIYRKVPSIAQILNRNERGIFRILTMTYDAETRRIEMRRVDAFNSASQTVVSAVEKRKAEDAKASPVNASVELPNPVCALTLVRYTGPKPVSWEPTAKDKPLSRGFFDQISLGYSSKNSHRLIQENFYDASGAKMVRKQTYEYPDQQSLFPQRRKVYLIEYNGEHSSSFLSEIHVFSNVAWYSVQSASIKRMHKPTKKFIHIYAEYPDASVEGPQRIFYKSKYPQEWTLVLKSTGSITTDASPNFAFAEFSRGGEDGFYRTIFDYSHPQHPTMTSVYVRKTASRRMDLAAHNEMNLSLAMTTDPGEHASTPVEVLEDHFGLLSLTPPTDFHLSSELADAGFRTRKHRKWSLVPPFVRSVQIEYLSGPCATLRKREDLWTAWRAGKIPGVFAREIDERFLRAEPILSTYWRCRDLGNVSAARATLSEQKQVLDVCLKVPDRPVTRTHLKIRFSDLFMLGVGGDAHQVFSFDEDAKNIGESEEDRSKGWGSTLGRLTFGRTMPFSSAQVQKRKADGTRLNVMNVDSGTWPTGGGGVGSCRRDLIDGLSRIRWNTIAEIGSAEAVQKDYQIERNIDSITYVVLWDVDFGTPNENVYRTENQRQLRRKQRATTDRVVRDLFIPLVEKLVEGCFRADIPSSMIEEYENVFVGLYHFFQAYDWTTAWNHVGTQEAWIQGWLKGGAKLWKAGLLHDLETPTLQQIDILFGLITRLLLPLTVKLSKIPVVHASHHGIQAIIGVIAKKIHGSGFVVWDHGILWRERLFGLCGDGMPRFTQCGFIGISRLVARIVFASQNAYFAFYAYRADYITPCTSIQNVDWEAWIGGGKHGSRLDNMAMSTKINPVLNGMDLSKFSVKRHLETDFPSAVMLSHISPVKDIMNAIGAANYIVNEFKLTSYKLNIYGSPEKEPPYTTECQAAIANMNLTENVTLCGLGSPAAVLPTGWVFVNSSITEGLPLALGEAGLCGLPVACTDVGGSREVVSNIAKGEVYGAIVPPSKPRQLAMGQLRVLAMTDGLSRVADPDTDVEDITLDDLTSKGPEHLEKRIMDERVKDLRRKLGMRLRERTISVFSIARYLREHEQILWCANYKSKLA